MIAAQVTKLPRWYADDLPLNFGNSPAAPNAQLLWETADANANALILALPTGGATDVPVFAIGDATVVNADLTFFNGITAPTFAVISADQGDYLSMSHDMTNANLVTNTGALVVNATALLPDANDAYALGASGTAFSDLFLASGAVINFAAGDVTLTHGTNELTVGGGDFLIADTFGIIIGHTAQLVTSSATLETQIWGTNNFDGGLAVGRFQANAGGVNFDLVKSRGATIGALGIVADDDQIFRINAIADDGTDLLNISAQLMVEVDDPTPAANDVGSAFVFSQQPGGGGIFRETMRLSAAGDLLIANGGGLIIGNTAQVANISTPEFQVLGTSVGADSAGLFGQWSADAFGPDIVFVKSRNATIGSSTIVQDNDNLGGIHWFADDGTDFANNNAAFFAEVDDASPAANDIGTAFVWQTQAGGGAALTEKMRLSAAGTLTSTITTDAASVQSAIFQGDRATPADGDTAYVTLSLSDSAGNQDEQARISWSATTVASGATQDGDLFFSALTNGVLTEYLRIDGSANDIEVNSVFDFGFSSGGTATSYFFGRDTAGTNQLQANVPTGAGFRWSINGTDVVTLSSAGDLSIANGGGVIIGSASQIALEFGTPEVQVLGTSSGSDSALVLGQFSANAFPAILNFVKSRNATIGSHTIVADNDVIGSMEFIPDDGVDFATTSAVFAAEVDDASPAAGDIGTAFTWQTMAGGGAGLTEKMRLSAAGNLELLTNGIAIGTTANSLFGINASRDLTPGVGNDSAQILISGGGQIQENTSGTHAVIAGIEINPITVLNGGGTEAVTNLAALYIEAAPTAGTAPANGPYSIFVDAGSSRFDGNIITGANADIDMSLGGRFFGGGIQANKQDLAANTNLTLDENDSVVNVTTGAVSVNTITLPAASGNEGMIISVYMVTDGGQNANVVRAGADVIQVNAGDLSNTQIALDDAGDYVMLQCVNSTMWQVIANIGGTVT